MAKGMCCVRQRGRARSYLCWLEALLPLVWLDANDCLYPGGSSAIVELGDANKPHLSMTGFKSWVAWR